MNLIIISGFPGTGKTTISKELLKRYKYSLISKDDFKEKLFEEFGFKSIEEKKKLDTRAEQMLFEQLRNNVDKNIDTILDKWLQGITFIENIIAQKNVNLIFIRLTCNSSIACKRYNNRISRGERPISFVALNRYPIDEYTKFEPAMSLDLMNEKASRDFNEIGIDKFIEIDTSNIENQFDEIVKKITRFIEINT